MRSEREITFVAKKLIRVVRSLRERCGGDFELLTAEERGVVAMSATLDWVLDENCHDFDPLLSGLHEHLDQPDRRINLN